MSSRPPTYLGNTHPAFQLERDCTHCELGKTRARHNSELAPEKQTFTVGGAGPEDLAQVKLIVISDYPGFYEAERGYPQVDITQVKAERNSSNMLNSLNSGAFIRMALNQMYSLDTYNEVWFTNAIKCNPEKVVPKENVHLKACALRWLSPELAVLDAQVPKQVPILVAGNSAFKAIALLFKEASLPTSLNACRRRNDLRIMSRACVFTENPAKYARAQPRIESQVKLKKNRLTAVQNEWLNPPLVGSPVWCAIQDLLFLQEFL